MQAQGLPNPWVIIGGSPYCAGHAHKIFKCHILSKMFPELSANCYHLSWHLSALVWFILLRLLDFLNLAYFSYFSDPSFRLGVLPQGQKLPSVFYTALGSGMRKDTDSRDTCWLMCWESKHGDRVGLRARNPSWVSHHASS